MKFPIINVTVLGFAALSIAAPLMYTVDIDDLVERSYDIDEIDVREWFDLEPRAGKFAQTGPGVKTAAKAFVDKAKTGGQLASAAAGGTSAKTTKADGTFHLDRQQPTNAQGTHKVAVQLNKVGKGKPSTVGQTAIHGGAEPSAAKVAKSLKGSINSGKEGQINHPGSKAAQNSAANQAKTDAKASRTSAANQAGQANAAKGNFRKGNK